MKQSIAKKFYALTLALSLCSTSLQALHIPELPGGGQLYAAVCGVIYGGIKIIGFLQDSPLDALEHMPQPSKEQSQGRMELEDNEDRQNLKKAYQRLAKLKELEKNGFIYQEEIDEIKRIEEAIKTTQQRMAFRAAIFQKRFLSK